MGWLELTIAAEAEAVDWVVALLAANGHDGRVDVLTTFGTGRAFTLRLFLPDDLAGGAVANRIHNALDPLRRMGLIGELEVQRVDEVPAPAPPPQRKLSERFVLLGPDAANPEQPGYLPLRLPRTAAFGSGLHPATVAVLRLLDRHAVADQEALDLGSGSGILSVALARLGLHVLAVDNDPTAVEATRAAVALNGVEQPVEVAHASLGEASKLGHWLGLGELPTVPPVPPERCFDLVAANLLGRLHGVLAEEYRRVLRPGGTVIAGGFTHGDDEAEVARSLTEAGLRPVDRARVGDYVALAYRAGPV